MKNEMVYDIYHMIIIENNYKKCIDLIEEVKTQIDYFNRILHEEYKGQANQGMENVVSKLMEHLNFYSDSCKNTAGYVVGARNMMVLTDINLGKRIQEANIEQLR